MKQLFCSTVLCVSYANPRGGFILSKIRLGLALRVPPHRQTPAQCGFFRSQLLVICAAKPHYTAAAAREHRRVLAPRLPTAGASVTSPLHTPMNVRIEK